MSIKCAVMCINDKPVEVYDINRKHPPMFPHNIFKSGIEYKVTCNTCDFIPITLTNENVGGLDVETYKTRMFNILATALAKTYAMPLTWDDITFFKSDDGLIVSRVHINTRMDAFFPLSDKGVLIDNGMNRSIEGRIK